MNSVKTRWRYVFLHLLLLWMLSVVVLIFYPVTEVDSGMLNVVGRSVHDATVALPLLAFLVLVAHGFIGTIKQDRYMTATRRRKLQLEFGQATACSRCGNSSCRLEIVDYEYLIFLVVFCVERRITGTFCRACAVAVLNKASLATLLGCVLLPPLFLVGWYKRRSILGRFDQDCE